jgi:hypothetical protein
VVEGEGRLGAGVDSCAMLCGWRGGFGEVAKHQLHTAGMLAQVRLQDDTAARMHSEGRSAADQLEVAGAAPTCLVNLTEGPASCKQLATSHQLRACLHHDAIPTELQLF